MGFRFGRCRVTVTGNAKGDTGRDGKCQGKDE